MPTRGRRVFRLGSDPACTRVLEEDADLASGLPAEHVTAATRASVAALLHVARGGWDARADAAPTRGGPGDLLRPLEHDGEEATLPFEATWRVLVDMRVAVLDRQWSHRMARFPEVGVQLTGRALIRARRLANAFAIAHHARLDARLHLLLWELADRYGRVHPDGVHLDLPLTHELLSDIAAARRPSVSSALARLADRGLAKRTGAGWLLHGEPPSSTTWAPSHRTRSHEN